MARIIDSAHKDSRLACWVEAIVHKIDTHVSYAGRLYTRYDDKNEVVERPFIKEHFCSLEMFLDLIKRQVIIDAHPKDEKMRKKAVWEEVQRTLEACKPFISTPLDENAEKEYIKYRKPSDKCWYEIVISGFAAEEVSFSLNLWGYKYKLESMKLPKMVFYEIADRLNAYIRFETDWSALDSIRKILEAEMHRNGTLNSIKDEIEKIFDRLRTPTDSEVVSRCTEAMVLLERFLREFKEAQNWKFKSRNMDLLINGYESAHVITEETVQMLRLVAAPYRDHMLHGHEISPSVAKVCLAAIFECFRRLAIELKEQKKKD